MNPSHRVRAQRSERRGVYAGSLLISLSVVTLLAALFLPKLYARPFSSVLLTFVLVALALAVALHTRFLLRVRRENRETAQALTTAEHEFQSIFDSALDGFIILNDQGTCLGANPAALAIVGVGRGELIGRPIRELLREFKWDQHQRGDAQGEMGLVRPDGRVLFVEYSAKANYLPGRHFLALRDVSKRKKAEAELRESDQRFAQMADHIAEIFWMIDATTKEVLYANRAFEAVTGRSLETLRANPTSYQELFHPEDRVRVLGQLEEAARTGQLDEEFRIVRLDRAIRWVWVRGFPVRDSSGEIRRLVGTAQDVTSRKSAEEQITRSLELAQSAWAEADALRKTTLALTQNLSMDYVLDTLLRSLLDIVGCDSARVLLAETPDRLFLARERHLRQGPSHAHNSTTTWNTADQAPLAKALFAQTTVLVKNTAEYDGWKQFHGHAHFRSWLGIPLIASGRVLGLLSLGDSEADAFNQEHVRLARSLAIPAAVAIQNARLYERAEIYGEELEKRLADLQHTERALREAEERSAVSEERFRCIFRASPVAFSIATLEDGRFLDVNEAFEQSYGYSRSELIGRTIPESGLWESPADALQILLEIRMRGALGAHTARFRKRTGEVVETTVSAQRLELAAEHSILLIAEELAHPTPLDGALVRGTSLAT